MLKRSKLTLGAVAVLFAIAVAVLVIQRDDTVLGLNLGLELQGGSHLVYQALDPKTKEPFQGDAEKMDEVKRLMEYRLASAGIGGAVVQVMGDDRLLNQIPNVDDTERAKYVIETTAHLEHPAGY